MHTVMAGLTCFAQRHSPCTQSHGWFDLLHTKTPCTVMAGLICFAQKHSLYMQVAWHWVLLKKTFSGMKLNLVYLALTCTNTVHTQIRPAHLRIAQIWPASSDPHTVQIWPALPGIHSQSHSTNVSGQLHLACTQPKQIWPIASGLHTAQTDLANCIWLAHCTDLASFSWLVHSTELPNCIWLAHSTDLASIIRLAHSTKQIWPNVFGLHTAHIWPILYGLHTAQTDLTSFIWPVHSTYRFGHLYLACTRHIFGQFYPACTLHNVLYMACTQQKQILAVLPGLYTAQAELTSFIGLAQKQDTLADLASLIWLEQRQFTDLASLIWLEPRQFTDLASLIWLEQTVYRPG